MKIEIPKLASTHVLSFCQVLSNYPDAQTYSFDVTNVKNYEPLPMLLAASAIRQFRQAHALEPHQTPLLFSDNSAFQYAGHMGFFQAAGFPHGKAPGQATGSTSYIPLTKINIEELMRESFKTGSYIDQGDVIELKCQKMSRVLSQKEDQLQIILQYLLREAIRNIPEHAETTDVWLCGQYWPTIDLAEIAILDEGIGIYNSLIKNRIHRDYIKDNEEALRWAIMPGVSTAFSPARGQRSNDTWANSGYGLYMISEICKRVGGELSVISGDRCLIVKPNTTTMLNTVFKGTALGIRIKPSMIGQSKSIIDQVRLNGEDKAKSIKTAFKRASIPSKGLMYE